MTKHLSPDEIGLEANGEVNAQQAEDSGVLLWVVPGGKLHELGSVTDAVSELPIWVNGSEGTEPSTDCRECGGTRWGEVIVREHPKCGRVGADGFRLLDGSLACPKCEVQVEDPSTFPRVSSVWACLSCGYLSDESPASLNIP